MDGNYNCLYSKLELSAVMDQMDGLTMVLDQVLNFCSAQTLLKARLVNRRWNNLVIPYLRRRHATINFCCYRCIKRFNEEMQNTLEFPFGSFRMCTESESLPSEFLENFGKQLLSFCIWSNKFSIAQVMLMLTVCVNLETLRMNSDNLSGAQSVSSDLRKYRLLKLKNIEFLKSLSDKEFNQEFLNEFFACIPNLNAIRFDCCNVEFISKAFLAMKSLSVHNISELDFCTNISEDEINNIIDLNFSLRKLKLGHLEIKSTFWALIKLLESQKKSLEEFELLSISILKQSTGDVELAPFRFPTMPSLKALFMDEAIILSPYREYINFEPIFISTYFPVLETIAILEVDFISLFQQSSPTETVKALEICIDDPYRRDLLPPEDYWKIQNMFPNLQNMTLTFASSDWILAIFTYLPQLKELAFKFCQFKDLDSHLTGIKRGRCRKFNERGKSVVEKESIETYLSYRKRPSLCVLTMLSKLKIHLYSDQPIRNPCLTDATGYLALLQIKPLDHLEITHFSSKFSKHCVAELKKYHREVNFI